jgi:stage III sporulation protein AD
VDIIQLVGLGLVAAVLILVIREQKPLFAFLLAAFTGLYVFLELAGRIEEVIAMLQRLAERSGIPNIWLETVLKIIGIAYIAEFGAQIVRDAGQESVASKIEAAGRVFILAMAIPIIGVIIETVIGMLPEGG